MTLEARPARFPARSSAGAAAAEASGAVSPPVRPASRFDPVALRKDFPSLEQRVHDDRPLVYLDNAATAQKPLAVQRAVEGFYRRDCANVHRGVHALAARATTAYEEARETVARFLGAPSSQEVVFVRGATEGINLVARTFLAPRLEPGDEIVVSWMEHHANIVPWQLVAEARGATVRPIPVDGRGELDLDAYRDALGPKTRLVAMTHVSNAIGTIVPVDEVIAAAHEHGIPVLLDGAQAVPHFPVDVAELGCDFYVFSSHKVFGPSGTGALWGRRELLDSMPPWQGGGDMIRSVSFDGTRYADPPLRFEAGTPNIEGALGLAAALEYLESLDREGMEAHEQALLAHAQEALEAIPGVTLVGTAARKVSLVSFTVDGVHPHDLGTLLDRQGVAIRAGQHCAQPVVERFGLAATARASFAFYNTHDEVETLAAAVREARELFA